jgi:hypothetical protein
MTFKDIAERMASGSLTETEIDEYRRFCASWLFTLNEQYGTLLAEAAVWLTANREKYKSYAEAERAWEATEQGQKIINTKYRIRGVEALTSALEGSWFLRQREWKEANRL